MIIKMKNIRAVLNSVDKLTDANKDMLNVVKKLSENVTVKEALYLHNLLDDIGIIQDVISDLQEVVDNELVRIEDDLR